MKFELKWVKVMALSLSLPSSVLVLAFLSYKLVENNIISAWLGYGLFFFIITDILVLLVFYAYKNKNKL